MKKNIWAGVPQLYKYLKVPGKSKNLEMPLKWFLELQRKIWAEVPYNTKFKSPRKKQKRGNGFKMIFRIEEKNLGRVPPIIQVFFKSLKWAKTWKPV